MSVSTCVSVHMSVDCMSMKRLSTHVRLHVHVCLGLHACMSTCMYIRPHLCMSPAGQPLWLKPG